MFQSDDATGVVSVPPSLGSWKPILIMNPSELLKSEINRGVPLVMVMDVASSSRGRDPSVFISLKWVLVSRALISTTRDVSVNGSGLIKRQREVRGRPREPLRFIPVN